MAAPRSLQQVVAAELCSGCGVCAGLDERIVMKDVPDRGMRPLLPLAVDDPAQSRLLSACPGAGLPRSSDWRPRTRLERDWGPVLEVWEGFSPDPDVRFRASSGGAATAMALWALESGGFQGVAHIEQAETAYLCRSTVSTDRSGVLRGLGSRYAPASPGERLRDLAAAGGPALLVGKPCDVAGARAAGAVDPAIGRSLALTVAVFCAGVPTTAATLDMLRRMGVDPEHDALRTVRYRGHGWPGRATALGTRPNGGTVEASLSYEQSWGEVLARHRQWRCHLCPDHTGEFADVSVGDPWYRPTAGDPGRSLVVVRTEAGRSAVHAAMAAGYLQLTRIPEDRFPASQPNLLRTRGAVLGRRLTMSLAGYPTPQYPGFALSRLWWSLPLREKVRSTVGTLRRLRRRGIKRR